MVLSFPPGLRLLQTSFRLSRSVQRTPLRSGAGLAIDYAPARWIAKFATPAALRRSEIDPIRAFVDRLQGGLQRVHVGDWLRKWPGAHPGGWITPTRAGGGAFDGTGAVTALTASSLTVSTLPAGFELRAGDMVGLVQGEHRALHRIVVPVAASGAGVAVLAVEPMIATTVFSVAATAAFLAPVCLMQLTDEDDPARTLNRETGGFTLAQVPF